MEQQYDYVMGSTFVAAMINRAAELRDGHSATFSAAATSVALLYGALDEVKWVKMRADLSIFDLRDLKVDESDISVA